MEYVLVSEPNTTSDGQGGRRETLGSVRAVAADMDLFTDAPTMRVRTEERLPVGTLVLVPYDDSEERL